MTTQRLGARDPGDPDSGFTAAQAAYRLDGEEAVADMRVMLRAALARLDQAEAAGDEAA